MGKRRRKSTWRVRLASREIAGAGVYRAVGGWRGLLIWLWGCIGLAVVGLLIVWLWV